MWGRLNCNIGVVMGTWITAGSVFSIAKDAFERTKAAAGERETGQKDALAAVAFSVAALEAFMNEAAVFSATAQPDEPPSVRAFVGIMHELERSRLDLRTRFLLARAVFAGEPYNKGAQPYQDFDLLVRLRNAVVHLRELDELEEISGPLESKRSIEGISRLRDGFIRCSCPPYFQGKLPFLMYSYLVQRPEWPDVNIRMPRNTADFVDRRRCIIEI